MTRYHFNLLDENEQAAIIREKGVLIGERTDAFLLIRLYQVGAFYVEAYHHTHFNVILRFQSFTNTNKLEPYLEEISLEGLV
ncbi:MAG TPA: hypothetical protein VHK69_01760 [Chitinophagaceae bacterium]|nr:hypothetical protein [Chitinophagaceae bacterium]